MTALIVIIAIIAIILIYFISVYNSFVKLRNQAEESSAGIDVHLKNRYDLIPNLVETVKGYAKHEEETLLKVIEARNNATQVKIDANNATQEQMAQFQQSQDALSSALKGLNVVIERYPDLKANQNFLQLQSQLEGTENRIAVERQRYADIVNNYNTSIRRFPTNIAASCLGFEKKAYFEAQKGADVAPQVEF